MLYLPVLRISPKRPEVGRRWRLLTRGVQVTTTTTTAAAVITARVHEHQKQTKTRRLTLFTDGALPEDPTLNELCLAHLLPRT